MIFNPTIRTRKVIATLLATSVIGGMTGAALAASQSSAAQPPTAVQAAAAKSTVPRALTRAETAAEDVIGYLEKGQPAKSKAEARILRELAHHKTAAILREAAVPQGQIKAFQQRADYTARLSLSNSPALKVSQAANSVSRLMPGFYGRFQDPVPATVLRLDYLDRQVQLDSKAGDTLKLRQTVRWLDAAWQQLRPDLVKAGGTNIAKTYNQHVAALQRGGTATAIQKEAVHGLDLVDQMEGVFLGR
jgi:hypothetical protein